MLFSPYINLHRKWMLTFALILSVTVVLFVFQIKIPNGEFSQTGFNDVQSKKGFKTIPCIPAKNIVFLKTHKTAGSSVQNILLRYAHEHELTVAVPYNRNSMHFPMQQPFHKDMVSGVPWEFLGFNILCHHMVFNGTNIQAVMPQDSLFISIVREPVSLFESLYEYCELEDHFKMNIEEFARCTKNASLSSKLTTRVNCMGRNQMLYDFGVRSSYYDNPLKIQKAIEDLDEIFHFVMIAEYFDESIVILRHILCWDLDDVISLTLNARMDSYKKKLSDEAVQNLKEWNLGDKMLYDHFLKRFHVTMNEIGKEELEYEVKELRKRREEWMNYCVEEKVQSRNLTDFKIWSNKVSGYKMKLNIKNRTCEDLVKPEGYFTPEIRQKQLLRSMMKGAKVLTYGPKSLTRLIDFKYLNSHEKEIARKLLENQYKYIKRRYSLKERLKASDKNKVKTEKTKLNV